MPAPELHQQHQQMKYFIFSYDEIYWYSYFRAYENPAKPGQTEQYFVMPAVPDDLPGITSKPKTVNVTVAYHKNIGYGLIECPAKNGSEISDVFVFGNNDNGRLKVPSEEIIAIKEEVRKIANVTKVLKFIY
ncbi:hypothetical protein CHUAL_000177 [Chamberlinius hualienensis]